MSYSIFYLQKPRIMLIPSAVREQEGRREGETEERRGEGGTKEELIIED